MFPMRTVICVALVAAAAATDVLPCSSGSAEDLSKAVHLSPCKSVPCRLRKGTNQHIKINFTPDKDITNLKNSVEADVFGVKLPFVGVDNVSICDKIYTEDDQKAPCPLKAGQNYVYKDSFPVLSFYPSIDVKVFWALKNGKEKVICFEMPARIV